MREARPRARPGSRRRRNPSRRLPWLGSGRGDDRRGWQPGGGGRVTAGRGDGRRGGATAGDGGQRPETVGGDRGDGRRGWRPGDGRTGRRPDGAMAGEGGQRPETVGSDRRGWQPGGGGRRGCGGLDRSKRRNARVRGDDWGNLGPDLAKIS